MFEVDENQRNSRGKLRSLFQTSFEGQESKTIQSDAPLASIQEILRTAGVPGLQGMLDEVEGTFMDVSEFTDYSDMMRHVREAEVEFMKLDSKLREVFNHDVFEWLDRAHDERRAESPREQREREGDPAEAEAAAAALESVAAAERAE